MRKRHTTNVDINDFTKKKYATDIRYHLKPQIGNIRLKDLSVKMIQTAYNNMLEGGKKAGGHKPVSNKTLKNIHGVLHKALEKAYQLDYIPKNPSKAVELPKVVKSEQMFIEADKLPELFAALNGDLYRDAIMVAAFLGLRAGEVVGLTWDSIDFDKNTVTINKQLKKPKEKGRGYYFDLPKHQKIRTEIMPQTIADILKEWKYIGSEDPADNPLNLVFLNEDGKHFSYDTLRKHFKKALKKAGFSSEIRLHDLRHTFAVLCFQNEDSPQTVQRNLGHATANFSMEVYGHMSVKMAKESAEKMNELIRKLNIVS